MSEKILNPSLQIKKFQTGNVLLLSFSHFIHDIYTSFLAPLLPLIIENFSITLGQAGLLSTVMQIPSLFNPVIGMLVDRKGLVKWLIILSPTLTAIPMSLIGLASSYWMLLFMFFAAGISVAMYHVPAPVLIARVAGDKKGRGMSFYMTGGEAARTLGPIIAVGVVSMGGLQGFYPMLLCAVFTSVILYTQLADVDMPAPSPVKLSIGSTMKEIREVMVPLAGILTARSFMHSAMAVFLPVFIEKETGNLWLAGSGLALYEALGVAGVLSAGSLSDLMGRKKILTAAVVAAPVALFIFATTDGWVRIAMMLITGFTLLSTTPVMLAVIQEHAVESPSAANGLFMMVSFITRAVAMVIVGVVGDYAGLENMYIISSLLGLIAIPFVFKLKCSN
ncbi:putative membrane efflux protein (Permease) [Desulfamplus magnetovallimortis]|uniref:Putative membrane efflux protein (Permease) n=1 Tax=Desulfamplus magnetovallimortis TaxID=1246637 RepID=A0A1W1HDK9_9BACT|nr:MFS transporter [Desulfamplus magnetovallimortis]SLM30465.1 putative membrane efflux protein (Permease) [Desulfamplus magnetovallimortis]